MHEGVGGWVVGGVKRDRGRGGFSNIEDEMIYSQSSFLWHTDTILFN